MINDFQGLSRTVFRFERLDQRPASLTYGSAVSMRGRQVIGLLYFAGLTIEGTAKLLAVRPSPATGTSRAPGWEKELRNS
jgi:hypothetical protein